jgi:hypothetical protein
MSNRVSAPQSWLNQESLSRGCGLDQSAHDFASRTVGFSVAMPDLPLRTHHAKRGHSSDVAISLQTETARRRAPSRKMLNHLVGASGFEPPTPRSRTECSTRLSHAPTKAVRSGNCQQRPGTVAPKSHSTSSPTSRIMLDSPTDLRTLGVSGARPPNRRTGSHEY